MIDKNIQLKQHAYNLKTIRLFIVKKFMSEYKITTILYHTQDSLYLLFKI